MVIGLWSTWGCYVRGIAIDCTIGYILLTYSIYALYYTGLGGWALVNLTTFLKDHFMAAAWS